MKEEKLELEAETIKKRRAFLINFSFIAGNLMLQITFYFYQTSIEFQFS